MKVDAVEVEEERATDQLARSKLVALGRGSLPPMFAPDSLPPIADEVAPTALVRGAVVSLSQTPTPTPDHDMSEEEVSTGLFESWDWDEAPPQPTSELAAWDRLVAEVDSRRARARPESGPRREPVIVSPGLPPPAAYPRDRAVVTDPPDEDDDDGSLDPDQAQEQVSTDAIDLDGFDGRAAPQPGEPRPPAAGVDWPPPPSRPAIDYPPDWSRDELGTMIVIDPHRSPPWRRGSSRALLIDLGAWVLGFVAMFFTGLITTASAALVLFALSI